MKEHITTYEIANEVRLVRDQYPGTFLIVEGKVADLRMYGRFVDTKFCQIIPAHSKDNVIGAIEILDKAGFVGVLVIVDADFWRLDGKEPQSPNIFITDTHDLETTIVASPALEKLVNEYCSSNKVKRLTQQRKKTIRQILLEGGRPIGYLRWVSQVQNLSLVFEDLRFRRFIDRRTLAIDIPKMVKVVKNKSGRHDLDESDLQDAIEGVADRNHNAWDVCCGHDLICILSIGLCSALGSNQSNDVKPAKVEKVLRIAYEFAYFRNTQLYLYIKGWETLNQAFQVFPIPEKPQVTQAMAT